MKSFWFLFVMMFAIGPLAMAAEPVSGIYLAARDLDGGVLEPGNEVEMTLTINIDWGRPIYITTGNSSNMYVTQVVSVPTCSSSSLEVAHNNALLQFATYVLPSCGPVGYHTYKWKARLAPDIPTDGLVIWDEVMVDRYQHDVTTGKTWFERSRAWLKLITGQTL
jgi:hypothetical protein